MGRRETRRARPGAAIGISFVLLYGWYFAILIIDDAFLYVVVAGDLLYLAGAVGGMRLAASEQRSSRRQLRLSAGDRRVNALRAEEEGFEPSIPR